MGGGSRGGGIGCGMRDGSQNPDPPHSHLVAALHWKWGGCVACRGEKDGGRFLMGKMKVGWGCKTRG